MAAPDADRRQRMSNMMLILLVFNLLFLVYFNRQRQDELQRQKTTRTTPPVATVRESVKVQNLARPADEAVGLARKATEFAGTRYAPYALLRSAVIVAERLKEKDAAAVYNEVFPPHNAADRLGTMEPNRAAAEILQHVVNNHGDSPFAAEATFLHAHYLTPKGAMTGEAANAWETARNDHRFSARTVFAPLTAEPVTINGVACGYLDNYYRNASGLNGLLYGSLDFLVRLTGRNPRFSHALALILFAVTVRLALYPLTKVQMKSLKAMGDMQPQVKQIQEKWKDSKDPEKLRKMNAELQGVYKKAGVNPGLGCLLLFVQLPVFIVLYRAVSHYQCQFQCPLPGTSCGPGGPDPHATFLWITNLARPDNVLLGLYVVSNIVQGLTMQRPTADPQQQTIQKMTTWVMPIFFAVMMYSWQMPSAFVIYWLTFNLISIVQQFHLIQPDGFSFRQAGIKGSIRRLISPPHPDGSRPIAGKDGKDGKDAREGKDGRDLRDGRGKEDAIPHRPRSEDRRRRRSRKR